MHFLNITYEFTHISLFFTVAPTAPPTFCPAGKKGTGGICDCTNARGATEGLWGKAWCYDGKCYTTQDTDKCVGKLNNYSEFGDGTWCWNEKRNALCTTTPGKQLLQPDIH